MPSERPLLRLLPGRDKRLRAGSPWVYSNEIALGAEAKKLPPGAPVRLETAEGKPLGVATFNLHALIAARLYDRDPAAALDADWFAERLRRALKLREKFFQKPLYRLVHAEGDSLPGFIADRFGEVSVVQANTAGAELLLPAFAEALERTLGPKAIVLRNDSAGRALEGLKEEIKLLSGSIEGPIEIEDRGARFPIDVLGGQKTGWYLDIAEARGRVARLAPGARVLDLYCHTGAFAVICARAGAKEVRGIESSAKALELARQAAELNGLGQRVRFERADVFEALGQIDAHPERYDLVIADPPSFVKSKKDLGPGARAYRKLARLASGAVERGGFLFIASCSHNMTPELFAGEVAAGLAAAARGGRILMSGGAGPDHPVHPQLAETAYLKWLLLQID
ncbi:MAG TPA: class I SAM-dependent rRNA methyltransferase [Alphaproteobacteria bacterium]|jgi:23S rRNA (cytosine1962-C5)-methyltransferase